MSYIIQKIFEYDLVAIRKSKAILGFNQYICIHILYLRKVLMYNSHFDYIKNEYRIKQVKNIIHWHWYYSLMYEIISKDAYEVFVKDEGMFDFSYNLAKSKYHDDWNILLVGKIKDETRGVAIAEFVELEPKIYLFLVDSSS